MSIKDELQGASGLLKIVKEKYMPNGSVIAQEAIKNLGYDSSRLKPNEVRKDFNKLMEDVLEEEWRVYQKYELKVYRENIIPYLSQLQKEKIRTFRKAWLCMRD